MTPTPTASPASPLLRRLEEAVLLIDGAMGTSTQALDLDVERDYCGCENCTEILVHSRPELVGQIHRSFLEVGADIVETNTFGASRHVLSEFDLHDRVVEINERAASIARAEADRIATREKPRFVLGSIGPGTKLATLGQIDWRTMRESYREQVKGLIAGGVDGLLLETCQDLLQVKIAVNACLDALAAEGLSPEALPILVNVTIETTGTMLVGSSIEAAAAALARYPIASLGLNCATGPAEMADHVHFLGRSWPGHVAVVPNAGLPVMVEGRTEYPLQPEDLADALERFIRNDRVRLVGGCCGTTPEHIAAIFRRLATINEQVGPPAPAPEPLKSSTTSLYGTVEHRQENSVLLIGERMNASGSRAFKRMLEAEDWDGIIGIARSQLREGSHLLDINVDVAGRDNVADMQEIVSRVVRQVDAPLVLDSTQIQTLAAGLERAPGRCLINSANFEDGDERFDAVCELARTHNAALVIGTIDEDKEAAMARTAARKLAIATRAIERAGAKHGISVEDIFIDPLVLPISTGMDEDRRSALELVEGVRLIREAFPTVQITCGLSNCSFGLNPAARQVLNSVLLDELVKAGLTSAILHAGKILPLAKLEPEQHEAALDLIYDRRREGLDPLQVFIDLFKDAKAVASAGPAKQDMTLEERLRHHIIDGDKQDLTTCLDEAMQRYTPLEIINDHLLDGMKTVGELFGSGQMQLPFVLQSAEVMKMAVAHLEPHMEKSSGSSRGSIVLATVKGDVHDIGKNLVDIILSNNGFTVHNIGIKQPLSNILESWRQTGADAIGLSGLLVKSVHVMEQNLRDLNEEGITVPIILGGAALTRHYAEGHLRGVYEGSLYYGKDAFEGLRIMDLLTTGRGGELDGEIDERLGKRSAAEEVVARSRARQAESQVEFERSKASGGGMAVARRSEVRRDIEIPAAPFIGSRVVDSLDLDDIYPYINPVALFRGQWQFKKGKLSDEQYQRVLEDTVEPKFRELKTRCRDEGLLDPKLVYGYFHCVSEGDDLAILDAGHREIERFTFPRQDGKKHLCISDFFKSADEFAQDGKPDVIAMHCVTMGQRISQVCKQLFEANEFQAYLYMHGMGVETAEALAELWHKRIRQEMGIARDDAATPKGLFQQKYRGSRYSFGYPACPDMSDQDKLWRLLEPHRIGCELTENWQIDPEQSTSAIVVHHPEAKYFNV